MKEVQGQDTNQGINQDLIAAGMSQSPTQVTSGNPMALAGMGSSNDAKGDRKKRKAQKNKTRSKFFGRQKNTQKVGSQGDVDSTINGGVEQINKETKQSDKKHDIVIAYVTIVAVIAIALLIWLLIANLTKPKGENGPNAPTVEEEAERNETNGNIFQDVYDEATKDENTDADNTFQEAIDSAENSTAANAARVSQMRYFLEQGDYNKIIDVVEGGNTGGGDTGGTGGGEPGDAGENVCGDVGLGLDLRITCYNLLVLSYAYMDENEKSNFYMAQLQDLMNERMELERSRGQ